MMRLGLGSSRYCRAVVGVRGVSMISHIHGAANLLIKQHGEDVPVFAAMQADQLMTGSD